MIQVLVEERYRDNIRFKEAFEGFKNAVFARKESYVLLKDRNKFDESERVLVVFGTSLNWIEEVLSFCSKRNIHPLLFGLRPKFHLLPFSYLSKDYVTSFYLLTNQIISTSKTKQRIAFVGFNPSSPHDLFKRDGFLLATKENNVDHVFFDNQGDSSKLINELISKEDDFDDIVFVNDDLLLLYISKSTKAPQKNMAGFGGSKMKEYLHIPYITGSIDYFEAGKVLANLYFFLAKQKEIYSVSVKMPLKLSCSISEETPTSYPNEEDIDFYHDKAIEEIDSLNEALLNMDETDRNILVLLENGAKYETIADTCYVSLNTVKYRIKKIMRITKQKNKADLLAIFKKYKLDFVQKD